MFWLVDQFFAWRQGIQWRTTDISSYFFNNMLQTWIIKRWISSFLAWTQKKKRFSGWKFELHRESTISSYGVWSTWYGTFWQNFETVVTQWQKTLRKRRRQNWQHALLKFFLDLIPGKLNVLSCCYTPSDGPGTFLMQCYRWYNALTTDLGSVNVLTT